MHKCEEIQSKGRVAIFSDMSFRSAVGMTTITKVIVYENNVMTHLFFSIPQKKRLGFLGDISCYSNKAMLPELGSKIRT